VLSKIKKLFDYFLVIIEVSGLFGVASELTSLTSQHKV